MSISKFHLFVMGAFLCAPGVIGTALGQAADWPNLYDPLQLLDLHITMNPSDLTVIQSDMTFDIEKPAWLSTPGEDPVLVSIRRKSADPIGPKISYKIDINEYMDDQLWHGVKKLSLENGDDQDVVSEGLAWYFHRRTAEASDPNYQPAMANWATLTINGNSEGIYANVEQVDKTYLRNREIYETGATWLYKQSDIGLPALQFEPSDPAAVNTTMAALNYSPFVLASPVPTPDNDTLAQQLPDLIHMNTMMTIAALDGLVGNPDAMFSHGKNFYWADYVSDKRRYFPWDLDATIRSASLGVYPTGSAYADILLSHPLFRNQFNRTLLALLNGPLAAEEIIAFLDQLEPVLTDALEADPYSKISDAAEHFEDLRNWITNREENVRAEILADMGVPGDANFDDQVTDADYTIWADTYQSTTDVRADFSGDNQVTDADYTIWADNYGITDSAIPEPATGSLLAVVALMGMRRRES